MRNPFEYGGVVAGDAFCNRTKERADLARAIRNHEKLFVSSERRFGKTSLVQTVLAGLSKRSTVCVYVDLWPTDSEATFIAALAHAITHRHRHVIRRRTHRVVRHRSVATPDRLIEVCLEFHHRGTLSLG